MTTKKLVYIASPYTKGDVAVNVRKAIDAADNLAKHGFLPFMPLMSHFWHMIYPHEYHFWTEMDLQWVERCDCVLRLPGESAGADHEVKFAMALKLPVFHSLATLYAYYERERNTVITFKAGE